MNGSLPTMLSSYLRHLSMDRCGVSGTIPTQFALLTSLTLLSVLVRLQFAGLMWSCTGHWRATLSRARFHQNSEGCPIFPECMEPSIPFTYCMVNLLQQNIYWQSVWWNDCWRDWSNEVVVGLVCQEFCSSTLPLTITFDAVTLTGTAFLGLFRNRWSGEQIFAQCKYSLSPVCPLIDPWIGDWIQTTSWARLHSTRRFDHQAIGIYVGGFGCVWCTPWPFLPFFSLF